MFFWLGTYLFQRRSRPSLCFPHRMMIMFTYDFSPLNLCDFASLRENCISFFGRRVKSPREQPRKNARNGKKTNRRWTQIYADGDGER
jgi:hypothetical protein